MVGSLHRSFLLKILVFIPVQRLANIHYNRQSYLFSMSKKMKLFEGWGYISFKWLLWLLLKNNIIFKCQSWTWRMKFRILFVKVFFLNLFGRTWKNIVPLQQLISTPAGLALCTRIIWRHEGISRSWWQNSSIPANAQHGKNESHSWKSLSSWIWRVSTIGMHQKVSHYIYLRSIFK